MIGQKQKETMNWGLEVKESSIPHAGNVSSSCNSLSIGCLPERSYSPRYIPRSLHLYQSIIDGYSWHCLSAPTYRGCSPHRRLSSLAPVLPTSHQSQVGLQILELRRTHHRQYEPRWVLYLPFTLVPTSPVAVGHLVNHPADPARAALRPNVMVVPYEFTRKEGQIYPHLIPNKYITPEKFMFKVANNHVIANSFVRVETEMGNDG